MKIRKIKNLLEIHLIPGVDVRRPQHSKAWSGSALSMGPPTGASLENPARSGRILSGRFMRKEQASIFAGVLKGKYECTEILLGFYLEERDFLGPPRKSCEFLGTS